MKFARFISHITAAVVLVGSMTPIHTNAQNRKTSTKRATTTTQTYTPLKAADLIGNTYLLTMEHKQQGESMLSMTSLTIENNAAILDAGDMTEKFAWTAVGNTLKLMTNGDGFKFTTTDGGKTFTGTITNGRQRGIGTCKLYNLTPDKKLTPTEAIDQILAGKCMSILTFYSNVGEVGFPTNVKFTPGNNKNSGTYAITAKSSAFNLFDGRQGKYQITANTLSMEDRAGKMSTVTINELSNLICLNLGTYYIPEVGNASAILYIIRK